MVGRPVCANTGDKTTCDVVPSVHRSDPNVSIVGPVDPTHGCVRVGSFVGLGPSCDGDSTTW